MGSNKTVIFIIAAILIIGIGFVLFQQKQISAPQNGLTDADLTDKIFELKLRDYNEKIIPFSDFRGKALVINSWAAWCPFCRQELPDFAAVRKEFGDKVVIIAIDRQEPLETAKKYSDELAVTNDLIFLLDPDDSFYRLIGGFSMPETIFINSAGKIVHHKRGQMPLEEIRSKIKDIL